MPKERRGRGEGYVSEHKRPDGRWEASIALGADALGKHRRKTLYARTKSELLEKLAAAKRERPLGAPSVRDTVAGLLERWLTERIEPRRAPTTFRLYDGIARKRIVPFIGDRRTDHLTPEVLEGFYATLEREGVPARTRQLVHVILHAAIRQALRWRMVASNPLDLVDPPHYVAPERQTYSVRDARALLAAARSERLFGAILLPLVTGMREGEVFGLQWDAVDFDRGVIRIVRALRDNGGRLELTTPKTRTSRREVALPKVAIAMLRARREAASEKPLEATSAYVFPSTAGGPVRCSNFLRRVWTPLCARANVPRLHYHDLRHTYATLQRAAGTDLITVKELLGHSSITVTANVYSHRVDAAHRTAAAASERLFGASVRKRNPSALSVTRKKTASRKRAKPTKRPRH